MTPEILEAKLRAWGRYYGETSADLGAEFEEDARAPDVHPLARGMRMAPGSRAETIRQRTTMDRGGQGRRTLMARELDKAGVRMVSPGFVDTIPCPATRSGVGASRQDPRYTDTVREVQDAWRALFKVEERQAGAVRLEYQRRAMTQREKAAELGVSLGMYRVDLACGRAFIMGKLAA